MVICITVRIVFLVGVTRARVMELMINCSSVVLLLVTLVFDFYTIWDALAYA